MEQSELLRFVVSVLERLHLPYFVTGSTVTIFYGEPRFTNDISSPEDAMLKKMEFIGRMNSHDTGDSGSNISARDRAALT